MDPFETLLKESAAIHGHLCPGQVAGVRMAMLGCRLIGLDNPKHRDQIKKLLAFLAHGGLCMDCLECVYPHCPFGKGM